MFGEFSLGGKKRFRLEGNDWGHLGAGLWVLGKMAVPTFTPDHCPVAYPLLHHGEGRGDKAFFGDSKVKEE